MGNLTALVREGLANVFTGPEPVFDIFFCTVSLRGLWPFLTKTL